MEMQIDISEIVAFGERLEAAAEAVPRELETAGRASGKAIERFAQNYIPVAPGGGTARANTTMRNVITTGESVSVDVASTAQSGAGYPYPMVLEYGTKGDIVPVKAKALSFTARDGTKVVTRRVKKREGTHFFSRAIKDTKPFVLQQFRSARDRVANLIVGS